MKKEFNVNIPKGYFMSWFITTQAANRVTVTIRDREKQYMSASKQSTHISPPLGSGYAMVENDGLKVVVEVNNARNLLGSPHSNDITTDDGSVVGKEFTLCIEDYIDEDYNDVAISIIAWKSKG